MRITSRPQAVRFTVGAIVFLLALALYLHTECAIRRIGLALQVAGILTVVWEIHETRALFGHPSFTNKIKAYLSSFSFLHHKVAGWLGPNLSFQLPVLKMRAHQAYCPGDNPTTEGRIAAIEEHINSVIHERITQTQKEMDAGFQETANAMEREVQSRQADTRAIQKMLETTATGGLYISAIGASLLIVGVILSACSVEIADILSHLWKIHDCPTPNGYPVIALFS
jgi:hypothetical protein